MIKLMINYIISMILINILINNRSKIGISTKFNSINCFFKFFNREYPVSHFRIHMIPVSHDVKPEIFFFRFQIFNLNNIKTKFNKKKFFLRLKFLKKLKIKYSYLIYKN